MIVGRFSMGDRTNDKVETMYSTIEKQLTAAGLEPDQHYTSTERLVAVLGADDV